MREAKGTVIYEIHICQRYVIYFFHNSAHLVVTNVADYVQSCEKQDSLACGTTFSSKNLK